METSVFRVERSPLQIPTDAPSRLNGLPRPVWPAFPDVAPPVVAGFPLSGIPVLASVETGDGPVPAGALVPGMAVRCLNRGHAVLRAVVVLHHVLASGNRTPVMLRPAAFGAAPAGDLALPADQRIVLDTGRALQVAGQRRVAVRSADLRHLDRVAGLAPVQGDYVHLLLDGVDAVRVDGLWLETLHPGPAALQTLGQAGRRALFAAVPRLALAATQARYLSSWPVLSSVEARDVV